MLRGLQQFVLSTRREEQLVVEHCGPPLHMPLRSLSCKLSLFPGLLVHFLEELGLTLREDLMHPQQCLPRNAVADRVRLLQRVLEPGDCNVLALLSYHEVEALKVALELDQEALIDVGQSVPLACSHRLALEVAYLFS